MPPFKTFGLAVLIALPLFAPVLVSAQSEPEPSLAIQVDNALLLLSAKSEVPTKTALHVVLSNFPGTTFSYSWKQVQDEMGIDSAKADVKKISFDNASGKDVVATFPDAGLYEIRLTVTDLTSKVSVSRNTWVEVWDYRSPLIVNGKPDPLAVFPGILPPKVRNIPAEPGPFRHPRLFCDDSGWKDINDRCVRGKGRIASLAWHQLLDRYAKGIDPKSPDGIFLAQVEAYEDAGAQGPLPDIARGGKPVGCAGIIKGLVGNLAQATFTHWVLNDPTVSHDKIDPLEQAICQKLAKQTAQFSRLLLDVSWDRKTCVFKKDAVGFITGLDRLGEPCDSNYSDLALAYDFSAPWMTSSELRDTRNLLVAMGSGRKGPGQFTGHSSPDNRDVQRGFEQNGTFAVWDEAKVLTGLAVLGEESQADPEVFDTFLNPPKPPDYDAAKHGVAYDSVRPVDFDGGGKLRISRPYPDSMTWPHARKADVNNLQKEIWTYQDGMVTPWGFTLERLAYYGFITEQTWPCALVYARFGGFNEYVGANYYQTVNNWLYVLYPSAQESKPDFVKSDLGVYEHHTGGGDYRQQHLLFLKYMYPEDPAVDYAYASQVPDMMNRFHSLINTCIFALDPAVTDLHEALEPVAKACGLPLTKLDPELGIVCMRSGWKDDDVMLYFNGGHHMWGHMNAEQGSFAFFALGRHWSVPSGYHKVLSNFQTLIQVQNPEWAACPVTHGYMAENPSFPPQLDGIDYVNSFPTPSVKLLEATESPDKVWSMAACDLTTAYNFHCGGKNNQDPMKDFDTNEFMYPGLLDYLKSVDPAWGQMGKTSFGAMPDSAKIDHAIRTVLFVRGPRPYALIVDDFCKGTAPANYRWMLNDKIKMKDEGRGDGKDESFCVELAPGATSTEAVLLHRRDEGTQPGLPRLLIRDVSENDNSHQPPIESQQVTFHLAEEKYSTEETNSFFIERQQVVDPNYKILLFPYRIGEKPPIISWNDKKTELKIDLQNGTVDTISFDPSNPDHRTRVFLRRQ